jgi:glucose-6-phosphate isomerase
MEVLFDFENLTEKAIGAKGISAESLREHSALAVKAMKTLLANSFAWPLGWLDIPAREAEMPAVLRALKTCKDCDTVIAIGMGGSGLGTRAVASALATSVGPGEYIGPNGKRLIILDNLDEDRTRRAAEECAGRKVVLNPVSKSGNTLEMVANLTVLLTRLGMDTKCVVTTGESGSALGIFAKHTKSPVLGVPEDVGGRFSVISAVGFFPLAFIGLDMKELIYGALDGQAEYTRKAMSNDAVKLAAYIYALANEKRISQMVFMPYSEQLSDFGRWWVQLFAESLGKKKLLDGKLRATGMTPMVALGPSDQHSILQMLLEGPNDKVISLIQVDEPERVAARFGAMPRGLEEFNYLKGRCIHEIVIAELYGTIGSLRNQGRPNYTVMMHNIEAYQIGQLLFFYQVVVGLLGVMFNVNSFDQPAVVEGKRLAREILGRGQA